MSNSFATQTPYWDSTYVGQDGPYVAPTTFYDPEFERFEFDYSNENEIELAKKYSEVEEEKITQLMVDIQNDPLTTLDNQRIVTMPGTMTLTIGDQTRDYEITHYETRWESDSLTTHIYMTGRQKAPEAVNVTFSVDIPQPEADEQSLQSVVSLLADEFAETLSQQKEEKERLVNHFTGFSAYPQPVSDSPWIPSPEDLLWAENLSDLQYNPPGVTVRDVPIAPLMPEPLVSAMSQRPEGWAPAASTDMSRKPQPRYGWHG